MAINKVFGFQFLLLLASLTIHDINAISDLQLCDKPLFVENEILIEITDSYENCKWEIQTQPNRILTFSLVKGDLEQFQEFLAIHDGSSKISPDLLRENQEIHKVSRKDSPTTFYTTNSMAEITLRKKPTSLLQLKIQKAVNCPANLGSQTECGRILDEVSCYCAVFTSDSQPSHTTFCKNKNMLLISLESQEEEQAVQRTWGINLQFWTSGNDIETEGLWVWGSTNETLYPGYANWYTDYDNSEPNDCYLTPNEDCLSMVGGWYDDACSETYNAVCEAQP